MTSNRTLSLSTFMHRFGPQLMARAGELFPAQTDGTPLEATSSALRQPLPGQARVLPALQHSLQRNHDTWLVAEMSTGKTFMGVKTAEIAGCQRVLVLCPPHLLGKWASEIKLALGKTATVLRTISDIEATRDHAGFFLISRETAKLESRWRAAYATRRELSTYGEYLRYTCPDCGTDASHGDGLATLEDLERSKHRCTCGNPLWTVSNTGAHRYPLGRYIKRRLEKGSFDLLIIDEVHEYKGGSSSQGITAGSLAERAKKVLVLTGTLAGGYASTLFYLLWRFSRLFRKRYRLDECESFVAQYGLLERTTREGSKDVDAEEDGKRSNRKGQTRIKEKPGISPLVLAEFLDNTAFLRLADLGNEMVDYTEYVQTVGMNNEQMQSYKRLAEQITVKLSGPGNAKYKGLAMQKLLYLPDTPWREETVHATLDGVEYVACRSRPLEENVTYPKELELVEIVRDAKMRGRKCLIFVQGTERRDITARMKDALERHGLNALVLKSDTVKAERREDYLSSHTSETDAVICHPRLLQTGLDLIAFPTIIYYQIEYSTYTLRQSSRRSWRIGQTQPVEVIHLVYAETVQVPALQLVSAKARSSLALEGELEVSGLLSFSAEEDVLVALARSLLEFEAVPEMTLPSYRNQVTINYPRSDRTVQLSKARRGKPSLTVERDELLLFDLSVLLEPTVQHIRVA